MDAEDGGAADGDLDRGRQAPEVVPLVVAELRRPPFALLAELVARRRRQRRDAVDEPGVPVAEDDGAADLPDPPHGLDRVRPGRDVAQADELVDAGAVELGENGVQRERVAVEVGDEAEAHPGEPYESARRSPESASAAIPA